ncbi:MAG: hypothetical protein C0423_15765 [Methylibium sp.]|nr:hypothetical protein [Methylibium sp.]
MTLEQAQAFFERYRDAFNAGDGDAVADLWHSPSAITDSRDGVARVSWWGEDAPMRANMQALCGVYRDVGPHDWMFELRDHVPLGLNHAFTHVAWTLKRSGGEVLPQFCTGYQLAKLAGGWKVLFCTAYQEDLSETRQHAAQ